MTDAEVSALKRKRGGLKRRLTEFSKFVTDKSQAYEVNLNFDRVITIQIENRLQAISSILNEFYDINDRIYSEDSDDDDEESQELHDFESNFYETIAAAHKLLEDINTVPTMNNATNLVETIHQYPQVKLPIMQLPTFKGEFTKWLEFKDTYVALIHSNNALNEIQKFYYLKTALEGDAAKIINAVENSAANYAVAWENLCERYENKRLLVQNHIRALFNLNPITKESSTHIRSILDAINQHLSALKCLGRPVEHWDDLIIFLISTKFDVTTAREWEALKIDNALPKLEDMRKFLKEKAAMLETLNASKVDLRVNKMNRDNTSKSKFTMLSNLNCYYCQGSHTIYSCSEFKSLDVETRMAETKKLKLCQNCLRPGHFSNQCQSTGCKRCKSKHNTLLHLVKPEKVDKPEASLSVKEPSVSNTFYNSKGTHYALLSTALVNVAGPKTVKKCRILLDNGSQSNFITLDTVQNLGVRINKIDMKVSGVNNSITNIKGQCKIRIASLSTQFTEEIECLIISAISDSLPQINLDIANWNIPTDLRLADPEFNVPNKIDILLGVGITAKIYDKHQINLGRNYPTIQSSKLGWVLSGPVPLHSVSFISKCNLSLDEELHVQLNKFWELEECSVNKPLSADEKACEQHFVDNVKRDPDGRFVVATPFKNDINLLGDSKTGALKRFYNLERKLQANHELKGEYCKFMKEYEELGHMTREQNSINQIEYFLPHHGVVKQSSTTTRLRVVYDGSFATTTGFSRNDIEHVGPIIQDSLLSILLRFRQHNIAISADIVKMYRQVLVRPEDRVLQKIFWRAEPEQPLSIYRLNTVTYGTSGASFLAIRCLQQLAIENSENYTHASEIILRDFYVDDLLTGADSPEEASILCKELNEILHGGCMSLRKWISNNSDVLSYLEQGENDPCFVLNIGENTKTLGLGWFPSKDNLIFKINDNLTLEVTKRSILSTISQIFDPLGLLGACIIIPKMMLQRLWELKIDWDDVVTPDLHQHWSNFRDRLFALNSITIPRKVICDNPIDIQLHGFADASEKAYGGCVYVRSRDANNRVQIYLLCSKAKVAPLKANTIPRLELCSALILAKLVKTVLSSLNKKIDQVYLWSDSTVTLGWLKTPENLLKIFVANRVAQIRECVGDLTWRYVPTSDNPADLISRGIMPDRLKDLSTWWHGPEWLAREPDHWPVLSLSVSNNDFTLPELKTPINVFKSSETIMPIINFDRFSNYSRLIRAVTYCNRFIYNCKNPLDRRNGELSVIELAESLTTILKIIQVAEFMNEINSLRDNKSLDRKSKLLSLNPFLDDNRLLRVGGRLSNADLAFDAKHPIVLPTKHHFTNLLFRYEHKRLGHAGPQQLLCSIRDQFWPIRGKDVAKRIVQACVTCYRVSPSNNAPLMGNLPSARVNPSFPFESTGVDYCGPFLIKDRKGRGSKTQKCYLSIFVCLSSKATHIEVVTELSTDAFIAALKRFIARRGRPCLIHSDNATNFVGARNELQRAFRELETNTEVTNFVVSENIVWNFIPPRSPHFGGIWEAAVKRTKFHLHRIVGSVSLTFEELLTVVNQIEAILNSRPLLPLSNDPSELEALTPAHFLVGRKLTGIPEHNYENVKECRLTRFQLLQQLIQHFWRRWSREYLHSLQFRKKWKFTHPTLHVGDLVLSSEDTPPMCWPLARITDLHKGVDGIPRVATIRTSRGSFKRALVKLYPLPMTEAND